MKFASSTDVAITRAIRNETLKLVDRKSNYGLGWYVAIEDDHGTIEVHDFMSEANKRVETIRASLI